MKNNIKAFVKKRWLLIWIVSVTALLCTMIAYAEYPRSNDFMKRVVLSDESVDMMFSSNYLTLIENEKIAYQPVYVSQLTDLDSRQTYDVDVFVWNYDIDGSGDYYKKQIKYDLDISVVDSQGNVITSLESGKTIQIVKNDAATALTAFSSSSSSYTYHSPSPETLDTDARSQNKYTIKFSKNWDLKNDANKRVLIKATPTSEFPDLKPLAAAIGLKEELSSSSSGWSYYINEQRLSSAAASSDYDAYNLVLTGTGSEEIVIEWDPAVIALNKDFYEADGAFPFVSGEVAYEQGAGTNDWDKLTINADSYAPEKNYRNRYDIQLYKVNGEISSSWAFVGAEQADGICLTINIPTDTNS